MGSISSASSHSITRLAHTVVPKREPALAFSWVVKQYVLKVAKGAAAANRPLQAFREARVGHRGDEGHHVSVPLVAPDHGDSKIAPAVVFFHRPCDREGILLPLWNAVFIGARQLLRSRLLIFLDLVGCFHVETHVLGDQLDFSRFEIQIVAEFVAAVVERGCQLFQVNV